MRRITWPAIDELDTERIPARAWVLGWEALNSYAAGDNSQTKRLHGVMKSYESIGLGEPVPGMNDGSTRWKLRPAGGELLLEEAEWMLLKSAVEDLRKRRDQAGNPVIMGMHAEPLLWLDELLAAPPDVPKEELAGPKS